MSLNLDQKSAAKTKPPVNPGEVKMEAYATVERVMIFCDGEMKIRQETIDNGEIADNYSRYRVIKISANNPVFAEPVSEMSELLKIPLRLIPYPTENRHRDYGVNCLGAQLKTPLDSADDEKFSLISEDWPCPAGNVVVVRDDPKPLEIDVGRAMCDFYLCKIDRILKKHMEEELTPEQCLKYITPKKFIIHVEELQSRDEFYRPVREDTHKWLELYKARLTGQTLCRRDRNDQ